MKKTLDPRKIGRLDGGASFYQAKDGSSWVVCNGWQIAECKVFGAKLNEENARTIVRALRFYFKEKEVKCGKRKKKS